MPIDPTSDYVKNPITTYADDKTEKTKSSLELQKDDFLLLLIESLRNQDPMNPMDSKDMMAQMAQLSTVEQITNMSKSVEKLSEAVVGSQLEQASSLLGKRVSAVVDGELIIGVPTKVTFFGGIPELLIDGKRVQMGQIREVQVDRAPVPTPEPTPEVKPEPKPETKPEPEEPVDPEKQATFNHFFR